MEGTFVWRLVPQNTPPETLKKLEELVIQSKGLPADTHLSPEDWKNISFMSSFGKVDPENPWSYPPDLPYDPRFDPYQIPVQAPPYPNHSPSQSSE